MLDVSSRPKIDLHNWDRPGEPHTDGMYGSQIGLIDIMSLIDLKDRPSIDLIGASLSKPHTDEMCVWCNRFNRCNVFNGGWVKMKGKIVGG